MDYVKLYESLKTIKEFCSKSNCNTCPMSVVLDSICMVSDNKYGEILKIGN